MDIVRKKLEAFYYVYKETGFNSVDKVVSPQLLSILVSWFLSAAVTLFSLLGETFTEWWIAKSNDDHQNAILQNILYWGKEYQTPSETRLNRCQKISKFSYETIERKDSILTSPLFFLPSPSSSLITLSVIRGKQPFRVFYLGSDALRCPCDTAEGTQDHNLHLQIWRPGCCAEKENVTETNEKTKEGTERETEEDNDIVKVKLESKCNLGFFVNVYESNLCVKALLPWIITFLRL